MENFEDYQEIVTTIGELKEGDKVMGTDGQWHDIELLPIHIPERMYKISFENGSIKCSGDHQWNLYGITDTPAIVNTDIIFEEFNNDFENFKNYSIGLLGGPRIIGIKEIDPEPVRCIHIIYEEGEESDHLFEILTEVENLGELEIEIEN